MSWALFLASAHGLLAANAMYLDLAGTLAGTGDAGHGEAGHGGTGHGGGGR